MGGFPATGSGILLWLRSWLGIFTTVLVVIAMFWSIFEYAKRVFEQFAPTKQVGHWIEQLKSHFSRDQTLHIFGSYEHEPIVQVEGMLALTPETFRVANGIREELESAKPRKNNEPHGLVIMKPEPAWSASTVHLRVWSLDYAIVKALAGATGETINLLSANAVLVCQERQLLILHRRSHSSRTYPNCLHTVGGAYMAQGWGAKFDASLRDTVVREVNEEIKIHITIDQSPPLLCMEELKTGFIQVAFLGVMLSDQQFRRIPENPNSEEGWPEIVPFSSLPDALRDPSWVPTGKAAVLAWLALGAPNAGQRPRFGTLTAADLFGEVARGFHVDALPVVGRAVGS